MTQFEIAKMIYDSDGGLSVEKIMHRTGTVESTVRTALHKLESKDIVVNEGGVYKQHSDASEGDLERIRAYTIEELENDR